MADRGFTVTSQKHLITAGNLKLDIELDADGVPEMVLVNVGPPGGVTFGAEQLERAATVIEHMRHEAGDRRRVCATHGYYENTTYPYACARCKTEEAAELAGGDQAAAS